MTSLTELVTNFKVEEDLISVYLSLPSVVFLTNMTAMFSPLQILCKPSEDLPS